MDLKITVVGRTELQRGLAQANRVAQEQTEHMMLQALQLVQADARQIVKKDTEKLMGSIRPYLIEERDSLIGVLEPLGLPRPYALPVEKGRGADKPWPPFARIAIWVGRHRDPRMTFLQQVFWVRRKVGTKGIDAAPFMLPAYNQNRQRIIDLFAQIGQAVVTRIVRGT